MNLSRRSMVRTTSACAPREWSRVRGRPGWRGTGGRLRRRAAGPCGSCSPDVAARGGASAASPGRCRPAGAARLGTRHSLPPRPLQNASGEEVVALVVDDEERREVDDLDPPDRLHAEVREVDHLDLADRVLREDRCRTTDRAEVEAAVLLAGIDDRLAAVALRERDV